MAVALTNHALERANQRNVDTVFITKVVQRCADMLREKEIKLRVGNTVIVARRDNKGTPVVITTWSVKR